MIKRLEGETEPMRARFAVMTVAMAIAVCNAALACVPFFPYAYFAFGRERDVLKLPEASFYQELCRVLSTYPEPMWADEAAELRSRSRDADANGLIESLKAAQVPDEVATPIVESYRTARGQSPPASTNLHESLPREFALYAEGASLYHAGKLDESIAKWKELLALPAEQRRYKSVWAAYMVGRALRDSDGAQANAAFEQARALAADGFADPLDLAGEGLGWEAYIANGASDTAGAILKYVEQFKRCGRCRTACDSLNQVCSRAFDSMDSLAACAKNETCRSVITAWVVAHPAFASTNRPWAQLLASEDPARVPQADMLAWIAYSGGDFDSARKLVAAPSAATAYGQWVDSKLLLRDGRIDDAMALMQQLPPDLLMPRDLGEYPGDYYGSDPPHTSADAELGVLLLGRQKYVDAFDRFLRAGFWLDAAYIGERVLTIQELKQYLDEHAADPALARPLPSEYYLMDLLGRDSQERQRRPTEADVVRYMVARRLARAGRWAEAIAYFPADHAGIAKQLSAAIEAGMAGQPPKSEQKYWEWVIGRKPRAVVDRARASDLHIAAKLAREHGMELLGTEVQPDWRMFGGLFALPGFYGGRARWEGPEVPKYRSGYEPAPEKLPEELTRVLSASEDELRRVRESAPTPDKRFHYRYTAADLMWQAAQLLPNDDIETMRALYTGGQYLAKRDPVAANKFYRALVWRNLNMPYAQTADTLRWFPEAPPE